MSVLRASLSIGLVSFAPACSDARLTPGLEEPIRVTSAQFRKGSLPGSAPLDDPAAPPVTPTVTSVALSGLLVAPGYSGKRISGRVSTDSVAVGLRLVDLGSGYWVFPVGAPDPTAKGEYSWSARLDFSREVPAGEHELLLVGIDGAGRAGSQFSSRLCFSSPLGDESICNPRVNPPRAVVSLSWDADADLDLRAVTPDGKVVDAKHPSTALAADAGVPVDTAAPGTGLLDRDSVRACTADGVERENLIFREEPAVGSYAIYANLYDSCSLASVRFTLSVHRAVVSEGSDALVLTETFRRSGVLLAADANGGAALGMFVTNLEAD